MEARRCTSESCLLKANRKSFTLDLPTVNILHSPKHDWRYLTQGKVRIAREIQIDWSKFPQDQYLFTHCSIVASCIVGDNLYYVMPPTDELINNNGNGWANEVLLATFKTFIGAENFLEHCQQKQFSKGKIIDAVLRPVHYRGKNGGEADIYFVDILVATNRKHDIVSSIENGTLNSLSMGCSAESCRCSKCGRIFTDDEENCEHLDNEMLTYFIGKDKQRHLVAELCGLVVRDPVTGERKGDPKSCKFIEASWVAHPAFKGAVINYYISQLPETKRLISSSTTSLQNVMDDIFRLRVADEVGMMTLKVAWHELRRRRQESLCERIARKSLCDFTGIR